MPHLEDSGQCIMLKMHLDIIGHDFMTLILRSVSRCLFQVTYRQSLFSAPSPSVARIKIWEVPSSHLAVVAKHARMASTIRDGLICFDSRSTWEIRGSTHTRLLGKRAKKVCSDNVLQRLLGINNDLTHF